MIDSEGLPRQRFNNALPWRTFPGSRKNLFINQRALSEVAHLLGHKKLPLAYPPIRRSSKSTPAQICSKQVRELAELRATIAALRTAASKPAPSPSTEKIASREAAKAKLAAEIAAAKTRHVELAALEEAGKPERDRLQGEWEIELREKRRERKNTGGRIYRANHIEQRREAARRWQLANPDKVKQHNDRGNAVRRQKRAAARLGQKSKSMPAQICSQECSL